MSFQISTLNIEKSRHLDRVIPWLQSSQSDIVCLQEVSERDMTVLAQAFSSVEVLYQSMNQDQFAPDSGFGICILSRVPLTSSDSYTYFTAQNSNDAQFVEAETSRRMVLYGDFVKDQEVIRVATTHFTWTPDGLPNAEQYRDFASLLPILHTLKECIFVGDLNAPRGGEIFTKFCEILQDNVPAHYMTSIDETYHRAGALPYMVDGYFSTPRYQVSNVSMQKGLSDHCAITGTVALLSNPIDTPALLDESPEYGSI